MKKKRVALFDIDKTIIKRDSMFLFLLFSIKKKPLRSYFILKAILFAFLLKLKLISTEKAKESFFYAIKFMSETDLEEFYQNYLKKHIYQNALIEMKLKKEQNYLILLVSASPEAYIHFFHSIPYVDFIIGTQLEKLNGKYINKIKGKNCKGDEKCTRIRELLDSKGIVIDYESSYAYSDSMSDLPMLSLVKNQYLINRREKGMKHLSWR